MAPNFLSYPCQEAISRYFTFKERLHLHYFTRSLRPLLSKLPPITRFRCVKLDLGNGDPDPEDGHMVAKRSGILTVDTVKFVYIYDDISKKTEIICSLAPKILLKVKDVDHAVTRHFHWLLNWRIEHLIVKESANIFPDELCLNSPKVTLDFNFKFVSIGALWRPHEAPSFYILQVLRCSNNLMTLNAPMIYKSRYLIINTGKTTEYSSEFEELMYRTNTENWGGNFLYSTMEPKSVISFLEMCEVW